MRCNRYTRSSKVLIVLLGCLVCWTLFSCASSNEGHAPYFLSRFPLVPFADHDFVSCSQELSSASPDLAKKAFFARKQWGAGSFAWRNFAEGQHRDSARADSSMMDFRSSHSHGVLQQRLSHPWLGLKQQAFQLLGLESVYWSAFDALGPVTRPCHDLREVGEDDEKKAICWNKDFESSSCVIFSVGSNNQWTFEEGVVDTTKCQLKTFDCTVKNPNPPPHVRERVDFFKLCLVGKKNHGQGEDYVDFAGMVRAASAGKKELVYPKYLKVDIEGFEFESLTHALEQMTPQQMPHQIALEVHFQNSFFDMPEEGLLAFSNFMFYKGYVLAHRRDNRYGYMATEVLYVKVSC